MFYCMMSINHSDIQGRCARPAAWSVTFHCPEDDAEYSWPFCHEHMMLSRAGATTCNIHGRHLRIASAEQLV